MALLMLTACPDHSETEESQAYKQDITLPSNATEETIALNRLSDAIETVQNSASWLNVEKLAYSSGSPQVKISTTSNTSTDERQCSVLITSISGDKIILSVTQHGKSEGSSEGTGIYDIHNSQTDEPAYVRPR